MAVIVTGTSGRLRIQPCLPFKALSHDRAYILHYEQKRRTRGGKKNRMWTVNYVLALVVQGLGRSYVLANTLIAVSSRCAGESVKVFLTPLPWKDVVFAFHHRWQLFAGNSDF